MLMNLSGHQKIKIGILLTVFLLLVCVILFAYASFPRKYEDAVIKSSEEFGVDKDLVFAVIRAESNFRADAVSRAGAVGLMQLMPSTAQFISRVLGEDLDVFSPKDNIRLGAWYLAHLQKRFHSTNLLLAAYNAGEGTVQGWIRSGYVDESGDLVYVPYAETESYLKRVNFFYNCYKMLY